MTAMGEQSAESDYTEELREDDERGRVEAPVRVGDNDPLRPGHLSDSGLASASHRGAAGETRRGALGGDLPNLCGDEQGSPALQLTGPGAETDEPNGCDHDMLFGMCTACGVEEDDERLTEAAALAVETEQTGMPRYVTTACDCETCASGDDRWCCRGCHDLSRELSRLSSSPPAGAEADRG